MPGSVNTNLVPGPINTNWEPGPVITNWGPGPVNTYLGPGPEPGPGTKQRAGDREIQIPQNILKNIFNCLFSVHNTISLYVMNKYV